jgi:topoisomerase-4 subunit A
MDDLKSLMQDNYIKYASYVILERAIPHALDGLKPVQRRILHALRQMHDGKLHKVANVVGQTMPFHPHGDAPIYEALVNLANREFLLERQGNFGNPHTGDPAAAARYIETRLLPLTLETLFNSALTEYIPTYDGRSQEPVLLPAKIPLLLLMGAEGIAVGMATRIFSHHFKEVLQAEIAYLKDQPFQLYPDFLSGGSIDIGDYRDGAGRIRLRAKIDVIDEKTLKISQICHSTTTEAVIQSIEEAAKKGKIKIESIHDYTAQDVDIEIKLPRGQYAEHVKEALYALTLCEVTLTAQPVVIYNKNPCEASVSQIIAWHAQYLMNLIEKELSLERKHFQDLIHYKGLERIFIENKLYRKLESVSREEQLRLQVLADLQPYVQDLIRIPDLEDADRLLALPMRRISQFDLQVNQEAIKKMLLQIKKIEIKLSKLKATTIAYIEDLIIRFADKMDARHTHIESFQAVSAKTLDMRKFKVGLDLKTGFIGTKVVSDIHLEARVQDKLLVFYDNGTFQVMQIEEKTYLKQDNHLPIHAQIMTKDTLFTVVYTAKDKEGLYAKRFHIEKFINQKIYSFLELSDKLKFFTFSSKAKVKFKEAATARKKGQTIEFDFKDLPTKSYKVRGTRLSDQKVSHVTMVD